MANPIRGEVELPVRDDNGEKLILGFDINRMCELEAMFPGQTTTDLVDKVNRGNMTVMRAFMWAGLRSYKVGLEEAGEILQELVPIVAGPLILDAMSKAFPKKVAGGEAGAAGGDPTKAPTDGATAGIGNSSSNAGSS